MNTEKLFYQDCYLTTFEAQVTSCQPTQEGFLITLDRTAFYPEGGGQPWDVGMLDRATVLAVREQDENLFHLCDRPLEPGSTVTGTIDWNRRFDLMQQHSGEHMVSGVIHRKYGWHNVGFHMGADVITIDFDGPIPASDLPAIEEEVNRAIWQNLPLHIWYPTREELPGVPYRSKRELPWPVRVVEIPGVDICACCGVHVASTGEIGLVKLLSCMKFHQGVRLEMVCGSRAMTLLSTVYEENRQVSQAFSSKILETGAAARRMNETLAEERGKTLAARRRLFDRIACDCRGQEQVLHFEEGLNSGEIRELADRMADFCGLAGVFSGEEDRGYSFCLASRQQDLRPLSRALTRTLDGRGGGKPGFIQGSVPATRAAILDFFAGKTSGDWA